MIRLTLRQFRTQAAIAFGALALVAIVLGLTGPHLAHLYNTSGISTCGAHQDCQTVTDVFLRNYRFLQVGLNSALLVLPVLVGIFWGAPLIAHELETGTYRLAWTQSITRRRWLAARIGLAGLAGLALTGLLALMVTWWSSPIDRVYMNLFTPALFGERGIAPIGYAAFAFAIGVTAGLLIRRTLPAMASTLVAFTAARLAITFWVRPYLRAPVRHTAPLTIPAGNGPANPGAGLTSARDWVLSDQTINAAGHVVGQNGGIGPNGSISFGPANGGIALQGGGVCPGLKFPQVSRSSSSMPAVFQQCIDKLGLKDVLSYQPASHYWAFQGYETAIFAAIAVMLAGFCFWQIRRLA
jgi:hypothetical protein